MSQAWKRVWKQNDDISYFRLKWLIGVDAGRYADDCQWIICTCTVVFHQNDRADYHDIIK